MASTSSCLIFETLGIRRLCAPNLFVSTKAISSLALPNLLGYIRPMASASPTVRTIICALGGVKAVAELCGVTENAVWNWVSAGRFPARTYFTMRDALKRKRAPAPEHLWRPKSKPSVASSLPQVVSPAGA